jgi:hypothetical protein
VTGAAIETLRREALRHARKESPAQFQDHEDAVGHALLQAVESGDYSIATICTRVRTFLRARRGDSRRPRAIPECAFRRAGDGHDDDGAEAPNEALDRVCSPDPLWHRSPEKLERLSPELRRAASHLREELEWELASFWRPAGHTPPWRSWARRIALALGRSIEPERVERIARAMDNGCLAPRGRQRDARWKVDVLLDGQPLLEMETAKRQVGALFKFCGVALADTQEHAKKMAVVVGRSIRATHEQEPQSGTRERSLGW